MDTRLGRVILLVEDYEEALRFYEKNFFCKKIFDGAGPGGRRYLHIAFSDDDDTGIWFMQPESPLQGKLVGNQTGGQPLIVIYTGDALKLYEHVKANGVVVDDAVISAPGSRFFHCRDLYGNRITVVELA